LYRSHTTPAPRSTATICQGEPLVGLGFGDRRERRPPSSEALVIVIAATIVIIIAVLMLAIARVTARVAAGRCHRAAAVTGWPCLNSLTSKTVVSPSGLKSVLGLSSHAAKVTDGVTAKVVTSMPAAAKARGIKLPEHVV
jgi:hypothetical protein